MIFREHHGAVDAHATKHRGAEGTQKGGTWRKPSQSDGTGMGLQRQKGSGCGVRICVTGKGGLGFTARNIALPLDECSTIQAGIHGCDL